MRSLERFMNPGERRATLAGVVYLSGSMSKRALKKYLAGLGPEALAEQILDLYGRFPRVKEYYDFVFNPREDKLLQEAKTRILKEYFPQGRRKPKARRSVAQKYIRQYQTLGMDPFVLAELMGFNLETAARYEAVRRCPDAFYTSMYNSFRQWVGHLVQHGLMREFKQRVDNYLDGIMEAEWPNAGQFGALDELLQEEDRWE